MTPKRSPNSGSFMKRPLPSRWFASLAIVVLCMGSLRAAEPLVIADFEGADYSGWKATGEAFGPGPAGGALEGQQKVAGFAGKGFANSYHGKDDAVGTLTSAPFLVERKYINFLIGGGGFAGETCVNLSVDGKVVRTATGMNTKPGGAEALDRETWEVTEFLGRSAVVEIIDSRKGGWGHVNVDQIVQSDDPAVMEVRREFTVEHRYLIWPVSVAGKSKGRFFMTLDGDGGPFTYADIRLSENPDFWVFTDLANFQGRRITVTSRMSPEAKDAWGKVAMSDTYPGEAETYHEPLRPKYHFTSRRGWINDPNGLVWQDGQWHLFYQHNPYNHDWDNMTWGHAVSADLLHWKEQPPALFPDAEGYMYSGSAVMAPKGRAGFSMKGKEALTLIYTAEGTRSYLPDRETVQGIASSDDGGRTFRKFTGNPVIPHVRAENRDPKVFWHEASQRWVLNLYYDHNDFGIHTSPELVKWEKTGEYKIPGEAECPDMFELPIDGDPNNTKWIVWGANGKYMIGDFDGREFKPESGPHQHYFGAAYAGQTYSNAPDGRRVHIGWMRDFGPGLEGAPFNLQMTLPMDFSLRKSEGGLRLFAEPSREVATLRESTKEWKDLTFSEGDADPLKDFAGGHFEIEAVIDAASAAGEFGFDVFGGSAAVWDRRSRAFTGAKGIQPAIDGKLNVRIFVDTVSMEVFVNGTYTSRYIRQEAGKKPVAIVAKGGSVRFESLKIHQLGQVWK